MRSVPIVLSLLVLPALAQDPTPVSDQQGRKSPLQELVNAAKDARPTALVAFIDDQVATGGLYAGQYAALRKLDWDTTALLKQWMVKAPKQAEDPTAFRTACIRALRDADDGDDELRAALKGLAVDVAEPSAVRSAAAYALAQFGDRSLVEKSIERATDLTKTDSPQRQASGWQLLADVNYNLREFDEAVSAYQKLIELLESGKVTGGQGAATLYYNCACSMSLSGKTEEAMAMVETALKKGKQSGQPMPKRLLETDMDIAPLRELPKFAEMMKRHYGGAKSKPSKGR